MKRVFSVALTALTLFGASACSGQLDYPEAEYKKVSDPTLPPPPMPPAPPGNEPDAGPSEPPPPPPPPPRLDGGVDQAQQAPMGCAPGLDGLGILTAKCGACHGEVSPTKGLDLVSPGVAKRLVGVKSTCYSREFLELKAGPVTGYFIDKLNGPVENCGDIMPFAAFPLTADEKACLLDWAARAVARGVVPEN